MQLWPLTCPWASLLAIQAPVPQSPLPLTPMFIKPGDVGAPQRGAALCSSSVSDRALRRPRWAGGPWAEQRSERAHPLPAPGPAPIPASRYVTVAFVPLRLAADDCHAAGRWPGRAGPGSSPLGRPLQELIHENMPETGTESRCLLSSAARPDHCHQDAAGGWRAGRGGGGFLHLSSVEGQRWGPNV